MKTPIVRNRITMARMTVNDWSDLDQVKSLCDSLNTNSNDCVVTKHPDRTNYNIEFKDRVDSSIIVHPKSKG